MVRLAVDGLDSLAEVAREPPDPVLDDLMMPRLDGISLRALLIRDSYGVRWVCMSADPRLVTGLGVPIVAKPFGVPDLFAAQVASRSWWSKWTNHMGR